MQTTVIEQQQQQKLYGLRYMLTASQGGVCVLVGVECCVYIPDVYHNVRQALRALASQTCAIEHLTGHPLQEWWVSLTTEWWWLLAVLDGNTCVLIAVCNQ